MNPIRSNEEFVKAIMKDTIQVFVFDADWCPDCSYIKPFMPDIEKKFSSIEFHEVNYDERTDLAQDLKIVGIPSFLAFTDGHEISRFVSTQRKTRCEIEDYLNKTLKKEDEDA